MTSVSSAASKTSHLGLPHFCGIDSVGHSGGLLLCWDDSVVLSPISINPHFILCTLSLVANPVCTKKDMYVMFIYGEPSFELRLPLWNTITELISGLSPFLIIGDFNQVELHSDKLGGFNVIRGQQDFTSWRLDNSLLVVPFFGPPFTWFNNRSDDQLIMERLDRAYTNNDWLHLFPVVSVMHLPILFGPCSNYPQLQLLQTQHAYWLQRAKLKNDILDGLPSRFLYSRVKQRSSHQRILALRSASGEWLFNPDQISLEITSFFQDLLCSTPPQDPGSPRGFIDPLLESLDLPQLSSADCLLLSAPFTELDIIHALNGMDGSKSPGPDGITPKIFQTFWPQLRAAEKAGTLPGLKISRYAPPITHLFYADDAFICCKATPTSFETLRDLFRCFELASGQMINL
ncbi:uncharacterized protein LOC141620170 [Silene latifolia]|uniref:uncharacterized protein LOC141620170 n=1 Tax=Silene latifolia TaxID=37657 RepID=UPI003D76D411